MQMGMVTLIGTLNRNKLKRIKITIYSYFSHDLLTICRELSLEDSLDELMLQLGADAQGRISYEQFLQRRLALRSQIDGLKCNKDNISDHSQGIFVSCVLWIFFSDGFFIREAWQVGMGLWGEGYEPRA